MKQPLICVGVVFSIVVLVSSTAGALDRKEIDPALVTRPQVVVVGFAPVSGLKANRQVTYSGVMLADIVGCTPQPDHQCRDAEVERELVLDLARATPAGPQGWTDRSPTGPFLPLIRPMVFRQGAAAVALASILGSGTVESPDRFWAVEDAWVDIETRHEPDSGKESKRLLLHAVVKVRNATNTIVKLSYCVIIGATATAGGIVEIHK